MDQRQGKAERKSNIPQSKLLWKNKRSPSQRTSVDPRFRREGSKSAESSSATLIVPLVDNDGDAPRKSINKDEHPKELKSTEIIKPNEELEVKMNEVPAIPPEEAIAEQQEIDNNAIAVLQEDKAITPESTVEETPKENQIEIISILKNESDSGDFDTCILEEEKVTNDNNRLPTENSDKKPDVFNFNDQVLIRRHMASTSELRFAHESTDQSSYETINTINASAINREPDFTKMELSEAPPAQWNLDIINLLIVYGLGSCVGIFVAAIIVFILANVIMLILSRIRGGYME